MDKECETCIKRKTMYCPNSIKCWATNDKPYYQNRIMLLEENKLLKKQLEDISEEFIKYLEDNWKQTQDIWYIKILQKYKEIIGGKE